MPLAKEIKFKTQQIFISAKSEKHDLQNNNDNKHKNCQL